MTTTALSLSIDNLRDWPLHRRVLDQCGISVPAPFVEIVWDNFCHLDAHELGDLLASLSPRVSFHVTMSKFLERTSEQLDAFLRRLVEHVRVVRPERVSDGLARYRLGRLNIALPIEHGYRNLSRVCDRVSYYQDRIGQQLLLGNHGSTSMAGRRQPEFFDHILRRTGCGLMFDVSSAVVAELNGVLEARAWDPIIEARRLHCRVGGYRLGRGRDLYHDTRDSPVTQRTEAAVRRVTRVARVETMCYRRDYHKDVVSMSSDLIRIEQALCEGRPAMTRRNAASVFEVQP